jgi:exodeoxyribonuclease VII small subunit
LTRRKEPSKDAAPAPAPERKAILAETHDDIAALAFEQALAELERIVDQLEKGTIALEDSIALYARGEALKAHCESLLKNAEQRIEKITLDADGRVGGTQKLDVG